MGEPQSSFPTSPTSKLSDHSNPNSSSNNNNDNNYSSRPSTPPPQSPIAAAANLSLVQPSQKKRRRPSKVVRVVRSVFRSFPIITPVCKLPALPGGGISGKNGGGGGGQLRSSLNSLRSGASSSSGGSRVTGTLYGYRKGRVTLSLQENPRTLPTLVVELAMLTSALQREMGMGMVRVALECEKRPEKDRTKLFDEPLWTMYCNGKKSGYGVRRDASPEDLGVMELLRAVSMGAGVLPGDSAAEGPDNELAYMRAHFERVVGSKDSETLYMISPEGNSGPELSIFFVRI